MSSVRGALAAMRIFKAAIRRGVFGSAAGFECSGVLMFQRFSP